MATKPQEFLQLLFTEILPGEGYASADRPVSGPIRRRDERKRNGCVFQPNPLAAYVGASDLMTGTRFKSSAAAMQKRWRPWCCVLPKKLMPRQTLKRSNARYAKRQSYILRRMWGQTPCERIKTNHTIYCNRRIYHERT